MEPGGGVRSSTKLKDHVNDLKVETFGQAWEPSFMAYRSGRYFKLDVRWLTKVASQVMWALHIHKSNIRDDRVEVKLS